MKSKPTKVRPPRVYRTKTGRPYIKYKGKKIYLNFGKKTNDMSTLNIIKLFLKYLTKKKRSTTTRRPKSVIEKPEQENREKVHMQIEKYLSDKYGRINEMDKIEEKKRREVKERAEEKKRGDEAKARQELLDADERKRDIDRAIERERKLQAELKADRVVSQTVLRQLTASNDRIERLIEEGKNAARDVEERAIVEAIPIEEPPRRPRIAAAPRRPRIAAAPRRERKRVEERAIVEAIPIEEEPILEAIPIEEPPRRPRIAAAPRSPRIAAAPRRERKRVEERGERKVRDLGDIVVEDITHVEEKKRAEEAAEKSKKEAEGAKAEAKIAIRNGVIEAMFAAPISAQDKNKVTPKRLIDSLKMLRYEIKEVKKKGKKMNAKDTIKDFLKAHPEKFDLGDNAESGWNNLLLQLQYELEVFTEVQKEMMEAEKRQEAKKEKEKTRVDSKQEAKQEVKDSKDNKHSSAYEEDTTNDDSDDATIEEVTDQEGTGLRVLKDACIKIIGKLKVGDIKKFLKKTHTDAYRKKYKHKGKLLKFNYIEALMLAMMDEKIRLAVCSKLNGQERLKSRQVGGCNEPQKGLTTEQLDDLMGDEKRYLGTVASDEIKTLKPNGTKYAFIMNTDKASKPGQHWIAVYISGKDDKTVEVYDPLGTYEPTKEFLEQIKTLVDKMNLDHYLLLKVNKIKNQSDTSDTCGWFAVKFLKERFLGNRFKFSTGFTQLKEDEIQKYKKQNGYGFDTYL